MEKVIFLKINFLDLKNIGLCNSKIFPKSKLIDKKFDYFNLISIDKFVSLLTEFETFKSIYFNKINKFNFEKLSNTLTFSQLSNVVKNSNEIVEINQENLDMDSRQEILHKRFIKVLEDL